MRYALVAALLSVMLVASACNLGASPRVTEEPLATPPTATGRPTVTIVSPNDGDAFTVDEQIFVRITASDSVGVTRAQLFADGQIVRTISSESISGDTDFEGVLDYTPRTTGEFRLRVLAFRGATASEPDEITVTVGAEQDDIIVTTRPEDSGQPVIPNDGVCRALTNVGLNLRSEPTTDRNNVITVLPGGTLAPIVARLGDNSWWKVSYNSRVGWVSAPYTTIYGNCSTVAIENVVINTPTPTHTPIPSSTPIPTATHTPLPTSTPGRPDLVVTSIVGAESVTIPAGETEVTEEYAIAITNNGQGSSGQFSVRLRVNDDVIDLGVVGNLDRSESVVLTRELTFDAAGFYDLRVDVDPDDDVDEVSEVNNRGDTTVEVQAE